MAKNKDAEADMAKAGTKGRMSMAAVLLVWAFLLFVASLGGLIGWLWWTDQQMQAKGPEPKVPAATQSADSTGKPAPSTDKPVADAKDAQTPEPAPAEPADKPEPEPAPRAPETAPAKPAPTPAPEPSRRAPNVTPPPLPQNTKALTPAPAPGLAAKGKYGPLPVVSPEGRSPWKTYRRPYHGKPTQPRIAIVMYDLGLAEPQTLAAIQDLPADISLAFNPYGSRVDEWTLQARAAGHEVLLQIPMEPVNAANDDPGPRAITSTLTAEQRKDRLDWILSRAVGYVGVTNFMGDQMTAQRGQITPVMEMLAPRGLIYVDARTTPATLAHKIARTQGIPSGVSTRFIDAPLVAREAIDQALAGLEREALAKGRVIAFARPFPVTMERLRYWAVGLKNRNIDLAPVSAAVLSR